MSRATEPIRPKVIIVATFEAGADTGAAPGEFHFGVEREKLTHSLIVPGLDHPVQYNDEGVYGVGSGTTVRSGRQIMALGLDPRFDLTHSYWLIHGIAGVNPSAATVGSAAWARFVIDGDIAYEIDTAAAPKDWPYGIMALGNKTPITMPVNPEWAPKPMSWGLNFALVQWAYELTKNVELYDDATAKAHRAQYVGFPEALAPPKVTYGHSFCSCLHWHGARMQQWADDWTRFYTGSEDRCAMMNMEDHGIANALERLAALQRVDFQRVDFQRVLFLRTGSNFSMPPAGQTAAERMVAEYAGMIPALEAAYRLGRPVVHALVQD